MLPERSSYYKLILIEATKDQEFIKECISNEDLKFSLFEKVNLIEATGDIDYIKECVNNENFKFTSSIKLRLIIATGDSKYIKECIDNEELAFSLSEKAKLIEASGDPDFIKKYIINDNLGFTLLDRVNFILATREKNYIEQCTQSDELDNDIKTVLRLIIKDNELYEEPKRRYDEKKDAMIKLPPEMTIGVEIESEGKNSDIIKKIDYGKWKTTADASLENGIEVVSPVLSPGKEASQDIYVICNMLNNLGQTVSERCGAHVHIGADYLKSKSSYINLLAIWSNTEELIYKISNTAGEIIREEAVTDYKYAALISEKFGQAIENGSINLDGEEDLELFVSQIKGIQDSKYFGINFINIGEKNKNTIEFRVSNGTIDQKTWIENINLFGGIIKAAEELAQIQQKTIDSLSEEEKIKLETFSRICSGQLSESELLNELLELTVSEEQKFIYQQRYEANSKVYEENPMIGNVLKNATARNKINIKDIGKKVFTGVPITGSEMLDAEERLNADRRRGDALKQK